MTEKKSIESIDPALGYLASFNKAALGISHDIQALRQKTIFTDGVLDAKTKALMAMICGINERCEPCLAYYVLEAKKRGLTEQALGEALAVVTTMGGCVGEMWALKAFKAYREEGTGQSCCHTDK
ncbi:carboxymuconolactone decarboxylase family protein [Legionella genomosp. 1]|uniref:carboxymuconolactone decarboxylase family protein n=1 Tax=Legionella genomosp. 1 TaxID=1093625 RepID=UPI00105666A2|nr:carboxymuconolactone decarboxylase family protein [Legionella genomosp. 1]